MTHNNLTEEQKTIYLSVNKKFGLETLAGTYNPADYKTTNLVFSSDPAQSTVPPKLITVDSIEQLSDLIGTPDNRDDSQVQYPAALAANQVDLLAKANSKEALSEMITDETRANLIIAARAYVSGNQEKVAAYVPLINALAFPMNIAYFAAEDLVVDQHITVTGPNPVIWNYGSILFKNGGDITADVDFTLYCASMSKES